MLNKYFSPTTTDEDMNNEKSNTDEIIARINLRLTELGIPAAEINRRLGMSEGWIYLLLNKERGSLMKHLDNIAKALDCNPIWLRYGIGEKHVGNILPFNGGNITSRELAIEHVRSTLADPEVKEITWQEAPAWRGIMHLVQEDKTRPTVAVDKGTNPNCFALTIINDIMTAPKGVQHTFDMGEKIIVDPDIKPKSGSFVVVYFPQTKETILREYSVDGNTVYLKPLNSSYPITKGPENMRICGVVVKVVATRDIV